MKICNKCKIAKPTSKFYVKKDTKDGFSYSCKKCHQAFMRERRKKNPEKVCTINIKSYYKHREKALEIHRKYRHTERGKAAMEKGRKKYFQTEKGKETAKRGSKKWREKNKIKSKAFDKVIISVRKGIIPPIKTCECAHCGNQAKHYHHYIGYEKEHWLDIIPLCRKCHTIVHNQIVSI